MVVVHGRPLPTPWVPPVYWDGRPLPGELVGEGKMLLFLAEVAGRAPRVGKRVANQKRVQQAAAAGAGAGAGVEDGDGVKAEDPEDSLGLSSLQLNTTQLGRILQQFNNSTPSRRRCVRTQPLSLRD